VTWLLIFVALLVLFGALLAVSAAAGSSRDAQAEEAGRSRLGADMCQYHVRLDEDGNEVLVTDPTEGRPAA
jgi:hypothetical protein